MELEDSSRHSGTPLICPMPFRRTNAAAWAPPRSALSPSSAALCGVATALIALACARSMSLIWRSARISRSCLRAGACLVCAGNGSPVPVIKPSRRCTKSRRCGLTPRIPADAVGVGCFLLHQHGPLAVLAFGVLFCRGRHLNHPADARFAALQRQQHANQKLEIDAVGLTPSRTPFHRNAGGIDDTVLDAGRRQPAVQPKPVVPGFVNRYHADWFTEFLQPESGNRDPFQGGVNVAPVNFVTTDGLAELRRIQTDQPGRFAQFKPTKSVAISSWAAGAISA